MALSSANALQAKTGTAGANTTAQVVLDNGTTAGSTVTIEIAAGGVPIMDGGLNTGVPAGFEFDAVSQASGARYLHAFHKCNVAAGEGVSGSTSWDFTFSSATNWHWRVTEWDTALDAVDPLEIWSTNFDTGTSPTTLSTGTTTQTGRADTVSLAWHNWHRGTNTAQSMTWTGHTNSFTVRDDLRWTSGTTEFGVCWSWAFNSSVGQMETTATINLGTRNAADIYQALLVVYAAAQPETVAPAVVITG